ncbi:DEHYDROQUINATE DEHYDRATASE/SHIKIMATE DEHYDROGENASE [Salix koriyanagi]|uniref:DEHYDROQUINATE DEHYDRATASE/SHIKIMATE DEHYDROGENASE n=1 Tax=Salix koriyanagi TaxID=2511006 RepID=A0A9Q1A3T9_9ROSI|nr:DEHYDROQUINATE DEHYDRATASE/SHIKIMATE DEHYDROGENASE [Salix koriyanagi]
MERARILTNSTVVCAPLMARSVEQMVIDMQRAKAQGADAVEVRLDFIDSFQPSPDLETIIRNKPLPVIIVYRKKLRMIERMEKAWNGINMPLSLLSMKKSSNELAVVTVDESCLT